MSPPKPPPRPPVVEAEFSAAAKSAQSLPAPEGMEIAFAGRSNVGKSSLMNCLLGRKNLVRTSSTPGCTRQIAFFKVKTFDGAVLTFVDLPGYGYAKRSHSERAAWAELIDDYLLQRPTLSMLLVLFDVRRGIGEDELALLQLIRGEQTVRRHPVQALLVATKLDRLELASRKPALARLQKAAPEPVIAVGTSLPETHTQLWKRLRAALQLGASPPGKAEEGTG